MLAPRCRALIAVDRSTTAVHTASLKLTEYAHVRVAQAILPAELPECRFDLVVASEILYYFTGADLNRLLDGLVSRLRPDGDFVLAHWRAANKCYGYDGFNVHDEVQRRDELDTVVHHEDENFVLHVMRRR